jgi:hypothetical protein
LPSVVQKPDDPSFTFWLMRLEKLKNFSLFHELMSKDVAPYLCTLCDRLIDTNADTPVKTNNYKYHLGQYSEAPRNSRQIKNDLILRVIRLLKKCE